jgi:hypothetical protein
MAARAALPLELSDLTQRISRSAKLAGRTRYLFDVATACGQWHRGEKSTLYLGRASTENVIYMLCYQARVSP